jgi:integrase
MKGRPSKVRVRGELRWCVDARSIGEGRKFFESKEEAENYQDEVNRRPRVQRTLHAAVDRNVTLSAFGNWWLQDEVSALRPASQAIYSEHLTARLCPFSLGSMILGDVKMRDLTASHVDVTIKGLRREGFAPNTVKSVYRILCTLLDRAVARGLLPSHPVTKELKRELRPWLKTEKGEPKAFTWEQAQAFLDVTAEHSNLHSLYVTGFLTGCRTGELQALKLSDRGKTLKVERNQGRGRVIGPTKSGKTRYVDIGTDLGALLDRIAAERSTLAMKHGWRPVPEWLFVTEKGETYAPSTIDKDFKRCMKLAGLSGLTPHSMRHSFASWHIARDCNPQWLKEQMGHSSISITLDIYGGWFRLQDEARATDLGSALFGTGSAGASRSALGNKVGNGTVG